MQKIKQKVFELFAPIDYPSVIKLDQSFNKFDHVKKGDNAMWIIGSEWDHKGNLAWACTIGSFKAEEKQTELLSWEGQEVSKEFLKVAEKKREEEKIAIEYQRKKRNEDCAKKWSKIFREAKRSDKVHGYLESKGLKTNGVAKIDSYGNLLIPIYKKHGFVGVQRIYKKDGEDKYEKRFSSGIDLKGAFCHLRTFSNSEYVYVAEGYATALSIEEATNQAVICVLNCNNIERSINQIRSMHPQSKIIICADRDINRNQPKYHDIGYKKAKFVEKRLSNTIVKKVEFPEGSPDDWSDFNDLHQFVGIGEVSAQLAIQQSDFMDIIYKGINRDEECCYFNTKTMTLHNLKPTEHVENNLIYMADNQYWGNRYCFKKDRNGEETGFADFKIVVERMFAEQREIGKFNYDNIRGYGVNIDEGRLVVNLGRSLYANGKIQQIFDNDLKSKYFYEANEQLDVDFNEELSDFEGEQIVQAFKKIKFKNEHDYIILTGWLAMAQVFGAVSWRPHIWLTGEKGSGKTTILNYIKPMIPFSKAVKDATSAGIKQEIKNNTFTIMYDEAEPNSDKTRKRMEEIIELARQCSSLNKAEIWRGSSSGKSVKANPNIVFLFSSIQKFLPSQADVSRFFVLELGSTKNQDSNNFKEIEALMSNISSYGIKLFVRMVKNFDKFNENIIRVRDTLREMNYEARQCDQLSAVIAGYYIMFETGLISYQEIYDIIKKLDFNNSDYVRDNSEDESMKCLETIYDLMLPSKACTIGKCISNITENPVGKVRYEHEDLESVGIKYDIMSRRLYICSNHHQLKKLLDRTMYSDYASLLRRHSFYDETKTVVRITGKVRKCVCLDISREK